VPLSNAEYRLLSTFLRTPRRIFSRDQLMEQARGRSMDSFRPQHRPVGLPPAQKLADDRRRSDDQDRAWRRYMFNARSVQGQVHGRAEGRARASFAATLFGRLALLLFVAVLASHMLALTLMFELRLRRRPIRRCSRWHPCRPATTVAVAPRHAADISVRLGALMLVAWIGARWLSQPIRQLVSAARGLGQDIHQLPLPEDGTVECREASRVFNQMQAQIRQQLDERDRFVAASPRSAHPPDTLAPACPKGSATPTNSNGSPGHSRDGCHDQRHPGLSAWRG